MSAARRLIFVFIVVVAWLVGAGLRCQDYLVGNIYLYYDLQNVEHPPFRELAS